MYNNNNIKNIHVITLPIFESHTGDYIYELFEKFFDIPDPSWTVKLVGVTIDGAANMTGCHQDVVTRIQNKVLFGGF